MIGRDSEFNAIQLDEDGTVRFVFENATGAYEELMPIYLAAERCLAYMQDEAPRRFGAAINGRFVLEIRLLNRPDARVGHIIEHLNETILHELGGAVVGSPWPYLRPGRIPEFTPVEYMSARDRQQQGAD